MNYPPLGSMITLDATCVYPPTAVAASATVVAPSGTTGWQVPKGAQGEIVFIFLQHNPAATPATAVVTLSESATTNGSYADITGATVSKAATVDAEFAYKIAVKAEGRLGFIRATLVAGAGASGITAWGCGVIYGGLPILPTS